LERRLDSVCASLRSSQGLHFFPRIFFLLFSLFHFYLFLYPFGFCYTALASTALFMAHSMLFFWHRYELPAVAHGHVTLEHPRMGPHHPVHQRHQQYGGALDGHDPSSRAHPGPSPYGPTPPGIPNFLLPARRTATPSLLRRPIHSTLQPHSSSRMHSTAPGALDAHQDAFVTGTGGIGEDVLSRPGSSVALVRDDADDDNNSASSYMYFMDGEVVVRSPPRHRLPPMHRAGSVPSRLHDPRRPGQLDGGYGFDESSAHHPPIDRNFIGAVDVDVGFDQDDDASSSLRSVMGDPNRILDDRSLREVLDSPPEPSRLRRRELFVHSPAADSSLQPLASALDAPSSAADAPETSSLQAILFRIDGSSSSSSSSNHHHDAAAAGRIGAPPSSSTPRFANRSSASASSSSHEAVAAAAGAPPVPLLSHRRRASSIRDPSSGN
jgi:hypothetical protein